MKTLPREQGNSEWNRLWADMNHEWFKVEVLQDYGGEDKSASLDAWLAGDKEKSIQLMSEWSLEWANACREKVGQGAKLIRIHVVDYPLSDYVQWEIEVYKNRNIPLGLEEVYVLDRKDAADIDIPAGDFMIFDTRSVVVNTYDQTGYAYEQTFYEPGDDISRFLNLREQLLKALVRRIW